MFEDSILFVQDIKMSEVRFFKFYTIYFPLNGVPKIPTASSAQMKNRITRRVTHTVILSLLLFTFLITSSIIIPVPDNNTPATIKSNNVQLTSSVNCIAINGMSKRIAVISTMIRSLFFCIMVNVFFKNYVLL